MSDADTIAVSRILLLLTVAVSATATPTQAPTSVSQCLVERLSVSGSRTCVRNIDGRLRCWGNNGADCRLGVGDSTNRGDTPGSMGPYLPFIDVKASNGNPGVSTLSVGQHGACAVTTSLAETKCWGMGTDGYNGGETTAGVGCSPSDMGAALAALAVPAGCTVLQVLPSSAFSCLLCSDRVSVYCWGSGINGALGSGSTMSRGGTVGWGASWPLTDL
eukprot:Hpha_TRINITY_DN5731_c0_g1::TRINITY_DN5731_c0_g1_i1::g.147582::m.147582